MLVAVADTHAVIWNLFNDNRLSPKVRAFFEEAAGAGDQIGISTITLVEVVYLAEKGRVSIEAFRRLMTVLENSPSALIEIPFDRVIVQALIQVPRDRVPELPDRVIVATARHAGVPLITRDAEIHQAGIVPVIW